MLQSAGQRQVATALGESQEDLGVPHQVLTIRVASCRLCLSDVHSRRVCWADLTLCGSYQM